LRTIHRVAPAYDAYWFQECAPVLNAGYRPPVTEGFHHFVKAEKVAKAINDHLETELKEGKTDPYDTHPPLKERIAAVERLETSDPGLNDPPATTLLTDVPATEQQLIASLVKPEFVDKLKPIDWAEVSAHVYLPQWTALVKANAKSLAGVAPESLPSVAADLKTFGKGLRVHSGEAVEEDQAESLAHGVIGAALAVTSMQNGAQVNTMPGHPVAVTKGTCSIEPFVILRLLADGKLTSEAWLRQCDELGIKGKDLGKVAEAP
jgi:heat shock protein HtpX